MTRGTTSSGQGMRQHWYCFFCSILNVIVAVTYPTMFSPRDVQITDTMQRLAFHTPTIWVLDGCPETLPHSHNVIGMRLLTIILSAGLVFPEYFYSFLHGYFKQFSVISLLTPDQCIQK